MTSAFILAVDGGGTKTEAVLCDGLGQELSRSRTGPCNLFQAPEAGLAEIEAAWQACCTLARLDPNGTAPQTCLSAGVAGINAPGAPALLERHFAAFETCLVSGDGYATLTGAFPDGPGALLAIGTGTVACRFDEAGRFLMRGGWGFPVGDEGGGARIGLALVSRWLRHLDHADPDAASAPLWAALAELIGHDRPSVLGWLRGAAPARFAGLAPLVFTHNVPAAHAILNKAIVGLARLVDSLHLNPDTPVALTGGLAQALAARLEKALSPRTIMPTAPHTEPLAMSWALAGATAIGRGRRPPEFSPQRG